VVVQERRLAEGLGRDLARPVIAICHGGAYLECIAENSTAPTFVSQVIIELLRDRPAELAARAARREMLMGLAPRVNAVVGMPIVIRPEQREERSPVAVAPALPTPPAPPPISTPPVPGLSS
jgi:hypothetical protein